jgi:hypothetical protein
LPSGSLVGDPEEVKIPVIEKEEHALKMSITLFRLVE